MLSNPRINMFDICSNFYLFQFAMKLSSPAIQASISSTVLGTMLINSAPVSVTRMSSSIRTPPVPRNWLILSATRNLLISGSAKARSIRKSIK